MELKPFAFIIINNFYILTHLMIICIIINMHCKRLLQNAGFTRRLYSVLLAGPLRAHGALDGPTALPQRAV